MLALQPSPEAAAVARLWVLAPELLHRRHRLLREILIPRPRHEDCLRHRERHDAVIRRTALRME